MAFIPEEQTLLIVVQGTWFPIPAKMVACRAGACPWPVHISHKYFLNILRLDSLLFRYAVIAST